MRESAVARQGRAALIREIDFGDVVATACRDRQQRSQIEGVGNVEAVVLVVDIQVDRSRRKSRSLGCVDKQSRRHHGQRGVQNSHLGAGEKVGLRRVERRADRKGIAAAEERRGARQLQRRTPSVRVSALEVILPDERCAAVRDIGDQSAGGIGQRRDPVPLA